MRENGTAIEARSGYVGTIMLTTPLTRVAIDGDQSISIDLNHMDAAACAWRTQLWSGLTVPVGSE